MRGFFEFLKDNPIVLFLLVAWVAGMIGNIGKAAKKARERAERSQNAPPSQPAQTRPPSQPAEPGPRSAEEVAREMRRILGLDPEEGDRPTEPPPRPVASPRPEPEEIAER